MEWLPVMHAAHDARETLSELRLVSWAVIGLAVGALVLAWGRIVAWLRAPDASGPVLVRWGEDDDGLYFELRNTKELEWTLETDGVAAQLETRRGRTLMLRGRLPAGAKPVALRSSGGTRLPL